jgi:hypothetical protein
MWLPKQLSGECRRKKDMDKVVSEANFGFLHWHQNQPK